MTLDARGDDQPAKPALPSGVYRVEDYGAVADGKTDCYDAITAAIAAAQKGGGGVIAFGAGTYAVSKELYLPRSGGRTRFVGLGREVTVIQAGAAMRSVIRWANDMCGMEHLGLDANRIAASAIRLEYGAMSRFDSCSFTNAVQDGVLEAAVANGINGGVVFSDCLIWYNGTLYRSAGMPAFGGQPSVVQPGTVSLAAGSATVTGTGTTFTAIPIRPGDPIRIGSGDPADFFGMVERVVDDTHLTLQVLWLPTAGATGKDYLVGIGNGYSEERSGDNGRMHFRGGLVRGSAGHGFLFDGLYGNQIDSPIIDSNGFAGVCVGRADGDSNPFGTLLNHPYFEGNPMSWWLSGGLGLSIVQPNRDGHGAVGPKVFASRAMGTLIDTSGVHPLFAGGGVCDLTVAGAPPGPQGPPGPTGPPGPGTPPPPRKRVEAHATIPRNGTSVVVEHGLGGQPAPEDVGVVPWGSSRVWLAEATPLTLTFRTDQRAPGNGITFTYSASRQP